MEGKTNIIHIITSLDAGGAERMLIKLLSQMNLNKYSMKVISMKDKGIYGPEIEKMGIELVTLNMKKGIPSFKALRKCIIESKEADIIQTWMYHADLLGMIVKKFSDAKRLIWGIHHNNLDLDKNKFLTLAIAKINAIFSKSVDFIVSCSNNAVGIHEKFGYATDNMIVIPNGFELESFKKIENARNLIKNELGIKSKWIISHVGRWNILKDYNNLFNSLYELTKRNIDFEAILCGKEIEWSNKELVSLINKYNLSTRIHLLGIRRDIPLILSASDVFVSSSVGEGFANVIGEAMACEVPCVVTNVGDSSFIVGEVGISVPSKDPIALSKGIIKLLEMTEDERLLLGKKARMRVIENFDIKRVAEQYESLYEL
mgnify:CR=1 FL=1